MNSSIAQSRADALNDHLPHGPGLRLIGSVSELSDQIIVCRAKLIPFHEHPLAAQGKLANIHLIEYAAQAAAMHLASASTPASMPQRLKQGVVATVRHVVFDVQELEQDQFTTGSGVELECTQKTRATAGAQYHFEARANDEPIGRGEFVIAFTG